MDRWHYRQYFSFPPRKTVKNLAGPGVGGSPTLGTRTIPQKGSPWDTEFRCPLVMPDLSQCLCSRVPPPHSAPALYNNDVSWYRLYVPPCTLLRILFEWSCTYTLEWICHFTYLQHLRHGHNLQYMYFKYSYDIPLYDDNPDESLGRGFGGRWDPTLAASPHLDGSFTNWSIVIFFLSPFFAVCFVLAIFMSTNLTNST